MNYILLYERLILRAQSRGRLEGYCESHHIIPRSSGGSNNAENLVELTAREHYLAHWLLFKITPCLSNARAFLFMVGQAKRKRGRDFASARVVLADGMRGELNVSRRPEVREKISIWMQTGHPYKGKKRPDHSLRMKGNAAISGVNSHWYGNGDWQRGEKNHMARAVVGERLSGECRRWPTQQAMADELGVTIQAVAQARKKMQRTCGWTVRYDK